MPSFALLWRRWTMLCALGEILGLAVVAVPGYLLIHYIGASNLLGLNLLEIVIMLVTGIVEGVVIARLQWVVLKPLFPQLAVKDWLLTTAVGTSLAWGLGTVPAISLSVRVVAVEPSVGLVLLILSALLGALLGAIFGGFQWLELKKHSPMAAVWIPANALAWSAGTLILYSTALFTHTLPDSTWPWLIMGAIVAGLTIGALTGVGLLAIIRHQPPRAV